MMGLSFLCGKKILARLKKRTIFALMCFIMKTTWFFQFIFQIQNLKIDGFVACNLRKQVTSCVYQ